MAWNHQQYFVLFVQFYVMSVHIGNIIKTLVKKKDMSVGDFSNKINNTLRNAYKIFDKKSIDTELLVTISKALDENLFFYYIKESELDEKFNGIMKSQLAMKVWDEFMSKVKAGEGEAKTTPTKSKPAKKPVKKSKK
jgi:hypothetical protein